MNPEQLEPTLEESDLDIDTLALKGKLPFPHTVVARDADSGEPVGYLHCVPIPPRMFALLKAKETYGKKWAQIDEQNGVMYYPWVRSN